MNPDNVLPDEMEGSIRRVNDLDPLDGTDAAAADLAVFAEDLRTAFPEAPLPERVAEDHIAAMIGAIQLLADKGESALEPTSNAYGPDRRASGLPKPRKRTMKKMLISVAVTAAMLVSLGGLAHAGVLPEPIQGAVGSVLGIDDEGDQGNIDDGAVGNTDDGAVKNVDDAAAVGDTNDGAVGDVDDGGQGNVDKGAVGNTDNGGQGNVGNGGQGNVGNGGQGNVVNGGQGNVMDRSRAASSLLRGSAGRRRAPDEAWRDRGSIRVPSATSRSRRHA